MKGLVIVDPALVLSSGNATTVTNSTGLACGADFCPKAATNVTYGVKEVDPKIYLLAGILLGFALLASIIIIFLVDPLSKFGEGMRQGSGTGLTGWRLFVATFKQMKNPYQLILIPLTFWCGFEQAFLTADYTEAFITCPWGVAYVGFVLICYGATDAVASVTCGSIVKAVGRVPLFLLATALNLALIIAMLIWRPDASQPASLFIMAALWGLADAVRTFFSILDTLNYRH